MTPPTPAATSPGRPAASARCRHGTERRDPPTKEERASITSHETFGVVRYRVARAIARTTTRGTADITSHETFGVVRYRVARAIARTTKWATANITSLKWGASHVTIG